MISADKLVTADSNQTALSAFNLLAQNFIRYASNIYLSLSPSPLSSSCSLTFYLSSFLDLIFVAISYSYIYSAVPIVDKSGILIGTLSLSDLKV